jgi:hypothetical protein
MSLKPKTQRDAHNLNNCRLLLAFSAAIKRKLLPHHPDLPDVSLHVTGESKF